ncbi:MAG: DUF4262 domain-containing protein [Actinomycetota bacterium]|nr:DUF4262 domain-containing protein [Actinomycetota bacterium]
MNDPGTLAWLDQEDARVAAVIRRYGWYIEYVGAGPCADALCRSCDDQDGRDEAGPSFAYTVGLFGMGHPELLIFGVPPGTATGVLNDLGERIRAGANLVPGQLLTFEQWPHQVVVEHVPNPGEIVFAANRHYARPSEVSVPVLQLSYDDSAGRFPWESTYATPALQPRPGTFRA